MESVSILIKAGFTEDGFRSSVSKMEHTPHTLFLPRSCQGYMYGEKGVLKTRWAALGLTPERIVFTQAEHAELRV